MSTIDNAPEGETPDTDKPIVGDGKYQGAMLRKELDELRLELEAKDGEIKRLRNKLIEKQGSRRAEEAGDAGTSSEAEPVRLRPPGLDLAAAKAQVTALDAELKKAAAETAELKDKYLRARAEVENVIRRAEREKADASRYAISDFARDVLGIGDNIQRAMTAVPADAAQSDPALASFLDGIQMLERELLTTMERYGVTRLDPMHTRFDPNQHQAVMELDDVEVPQGTVVKVFQPGYTIADRVLRPAIVAVSRGGAKVPKAGSAATDASDPDSVSETVPTPMDAAEKSDPDAQVANTDPNIDNSTTVDPV
jgi:molecular chaperone GrpE